MAKIDQFSISAHVANQIQTFISGDNWVAQTFTAGASGPLKSAHLVIAKTGTPAGAATLELRATSGGVPTGPALATAVRLESEVTASVTFAVTPLLFIYGSPFTVTQGVTYALVLYNNDGLGAGPSVTNFYKLFGRNEARSSYSGGSGFGSTNGGSSWASNIRDFGFTSLIDADFNPFGDQFCLEVGSSVRQLNDGAGTRKLGQTFTTGFAADLTAVTISVTKANSPGDLSIDVFNTSGGLPTGSSLGTAVISAGIIGGFSRDVATGTFGTPIPLTNSTQYALVFSGTHDSTNTYSFFGSSGVENVNPGGNVIQADDGSTFSAAATGQDFGFMTQMEAIVTTTQTIDSDATIEIETTQTIDSDAFVGQETTKTIDSDANLSAEVTQTILSDAFVGQETTQTIDSDATIFAEVTQTILSDASIAVTTTQNIESDSNVLGTTTQAIASNSVVLLEVEETILSDAIITRNEPELKLFASTTPATEVGIASNPIVFSGVIAGEEFEHPDNPFFLFNDKDGALQSVDANDINFRVLSFQLENEVVGTSDGSNNQFFTVAFPPVTDNDIDYPLIVKVGATIFSRVDSLATAGASDEVYEFNFTTGTVTFGDNITGKVPPISSVITITYTPDTKDFGAEVSTLDWLGVQSNGVITNDVTVNLERQVSNSATTVIAAHAPNITAVTGVFLNTDPNRLGTNFFLPSGAFNAETGEIILGTSLPSATETVLIDYTYEIFDDAEGDFTQIGQDNDHTFENVIPSNNAKKIFLRIVAPASTSPSGLMDLKFKIRVSFSG